MNNLIIEVKYGWIHEQIILVFLIDESLLLMIYINFDIISEIIILPIILKEVRCL